MDIFFAALAAVGVPAIVSGIVVGCVNRSLKKRDMERERAEAAREKRAEARETSREQLDIVLLQSTTAAMALGEATAKAVQRIPDAHCNGDMHEALAYAQRVKHEQRDFLQSVGVHALHEDN